MMAKSRVDVTALTADVPVLGVWGGVDTHGTTHVAARRHHPHRPPAHREAGDALMSVPITLEHQHRLPPLIQAYGSVSQQHSQALRVDLRRRAPQDRMIARWTEAAAPARRSHARDVEVLLLVSTSSITDLVTSPAGSRTKITVCVPKATRRVAFGTQTVIKPLVGHGSPPRRPHRLAHRSTPAGLMRRALGPQNP